VLKVRFDADFQKVDSTERLTYGEVAITGLCERLREQMATLASEPGRQRSWSILSSLQLRQCAGD